MVSDLFSRLVGTMALARAHDATQNLLRIDDDKLWEIGLRRADIRECLAADPEDAAQFLHARQLRNVMTTVAKLDSLGLWMGSAPGVPANDQALPPRREQAARVAAP